MHRRELADYNRKAWDHLASNDNLWTVPVSSETIEQARQGHWQIVLTPEKPVPQQWLGSISGARRSVPCRWWWTAGTHLVGGRSQCNHTG